MEKTPSQKRHDAQSYLEWLKKFDRPKTTDDTFTPPDVYENVLQFCRDHFGDELEGKRILRPFYPGGDFEHEDYTDAVVIDNPPFSILSKIVNFYTERQIPFFLFCNQNTAFGLKATGYVVTCEGVKYENGANVSTGFVSNMFTGIIGIRTVQKHDHHYRVTKVKMPEGYESAATMHKFCRKLPDGVERFWQFDPDSRIRKNDEGHGIYGCAYKVKEVTEYDRERHCTTGDAVS